MYIVIGSERFEQNFLKNLEAYEITKKVAHRLLKFNGVGVKIKNFRIIRHH